MYTTNLDDYVAFNLHVMSKSKGTRLSFLVGSVLAPVGLLAGAASVAAALHNWPGEIACMAGAVSCAVIVPFGYRSLMRSKIRALARRHSIRGMLGRTTLTLGEEALTIAVGTTRTEARWEGIAGVEESGDHTFIMLTGLSAVIVPRLEFESDEEYHRVRDFAAARVVR